MFSDRKRSAPDANGIKWDDYFNDPTDDLVIVANNGVHFRVSSHRMSNCSSMFRDMLKKSKVMDGSDTNNHEDVMAKPIELGYHSSVIRQILNQACYPKIVLDYHPDEDVVWSRALDRIACLDQLGCPNLIHEAWTDLAIKSKRRHKAFETLVMASDRNSVTLAIESMMCVDAKELRILYQSEAHMNRQLDRLEQHWATCLRQKIFVTTSEGVTVVSKIEKHGWLEWAHEVGRAIKATHKQSGARLSGIRTLAIAGLDTRSDPVTRHNGRVDAKSSDD